MRSFCYTLKDPLGLHARAIGDLLMTVRFYRASVTVQKGTRQARLENPLEMMALEARQQDTVTVFVEGADEDVVCRKLQEYFQEKL